jgi:hypothetical protein
MESLLKICLPSEILEYFDCGYFAEFSNMKTRELGYLIHLDEKNILPDGYDALSYESKGFHASVTIQDFPLRGKQIWFSIRKRRWRHKVNKNQIISRDFSFLAEGTRLTSDLTAFLKDTGRDASRYDKEYL